MMRAPGKRIGGRIDAVTRPRRRGITVTEAVVGMSVLVVVLSTMNQLYVGSQRLLRQTRHEQLVLDELTTHAETALMQGALLEDKPDRSSAGLSPDLLASLPDAVLEREVAGAGELRRVTWTIRWNFGRAVNQSQRQANINSRSLSAWLPATEKSSETGPE